MMVWKTIGAAFVSAVVLVAISLAYGHPSLVSGADNPVSASVETCAVCHKDGGAKHQASYDQLYQDGVI